MSALLVERLDGHVRSTIDRYVNNGFRGGHITESDYLRHLVRVVTTLGQGGGVVLLGRGSQFILRADQALRLLFVAPFETRVKRLARERSLPLQAAKAVERREFLRYHIGVDQADARLCDFSLNLGMVSPKVAQRLVGEALCDRFPQSAPTKALRSSAR